MRGTTSLQDLRILDLGRRMAGAMAGMVLADNGADVIKVEPPDGGPESSDDPARLVWDRGKRSITLDLRVPADRDRLLDLVAVADGLVHDWRPGAIEGLGLGHDDLAEVNPRIVSVAISGFGERGPLRDLPGYEGIVAARTGRMATLNGYRDGPIFTPTPIASYGAAMLAVQGLLGAVHARRRSGLGQWVHTSLLHALVSFDMVSGFGHRIHQPDESGRVFGVMDLAFMTAATADGRWIQMCSRQPHLFRNWLRVLGLESLFGEPGLADMPDLFPSQDELDRVRELVAKAMRERTLDEWLEVFLAEDVGGDPFLTGPEYLAHPQAVDNGRTAVVDDPAVGRTVQIGPLALLSDTPADIGTPAPAPGEHTQEILAATPTRGAGAPPAPGSARSPRSPDGARLSHPLEGVTVLEVGYFYAAPYAMTLLAEMGARVVKVEPPTGDPARRNWTTAYDKETVGKQSVVADMKTPEGLRIVHQLVERSDVLLHNFRPGVPERLGIGYDDMAVRNPRLVYVYGGAFGSKGPWARRPGFHSSPNAIAGSGVVEAGRGNPPINRTYADPASALATATATLLALHAREITGRGQYVETTMLSSMAYTVARWGLTYDGKPQDPLPDQGQHGFHALHRLYETADGWIYVECHTERQRAALAGVLGLAAVEDAPLGWAVARGGDDERDDERAAAIAAMLATADAAGWESRLQAAGVPAVRADGIDHLDFMLNDPHMRANELAVEATLTDGTRFFRSSGGVEFGAQTLRIGRPEPLGASTDMVLAALGYDVEATADLHRRGVTRAVGHGLGG
ncbi:MAG: CaiB/BaiF CoA transferase family protein [Acidimicrobiales bacterium]